MAKFPSEIPDETSPSGDDRILISRTGDNNIAKDARLRDLPTADIVQGALDDLSVGLGTHTHSFLSIQGKPTTIAGYGITDAYTKTEIDAQADGYAKLSGANFTGGLTQNGQTVGNPDFYKYQIVRTVNSGNLTVSLKNFLGNDPNPTVPVKVQIGGVVRTITSALSVTINAGVNWYNAGSSELATKEIDYFIYIGRKTSNGVFYIIPSRIPNALINTDVSSSVSNEKFGFGADNLDSGDSIQNIGRINATLSASPYNWSIPATSVIIHEPIYETRVLTISSVLGGFSSVSQNLIKYKIVGSSLQILGQGPIYGASNSTTFTFTIPFQAKVRLIATPVFIRDASVFQVIPGYIEIPTGTYTANVGKTFFGGAWTATGTKDAFLDYFTYEI